VSFLFCGFRLFLVLRRFGGFFVLSRLGRLFVLGGLGGFFVMLFLRKGWKGGAEKNQKSCGADESYDFHEYCLH